MSTLERRIVELLSVSGALTLMEIAEKLNKNPKIVFKTLRKLFEEGRVGCDIKTRKYYLEEGYEERQEGEIENIEV